MIELKELRKSYKTGSFEQKALDGVTLTLRDNEFVAVLGPSGSGKTTLLNVLGGLDRADSGDIVINGVSTADYKSADWDTYRNHRIGFIFQSYNLIPHQSVLGNVELALTLAGVGSAERKKRAAEALERVGLGDHINKKPNQLSGGQMQRVAIARALVNDPDIVLADEPTGALDTETGVAVMDLLKEIAQDRLVVMVTHNPELAEEYATRIVRLADGKIVSDTNPLAADEEAASEEAASEGTEAAAASEEAEGVLEGSATPVAAAVAAPVAAATEAFPKRRAKMGFLTALGLSFNNLMTKKGRTFMTAFAGSIGIIGIAAILSLSNGVNNYIADTEEQALTSYPITITKSSFDFSGLIGGFQEGNVESEEEEKSKFEKGLEGLAGEEKEESATPAPSSSIVEVPMMTQMFAQVKNNNLKDLKAFLDSSDSGIDPYVHTIQYSYGIVPHIYSTDTSEGVVQLNPSNMGYALTGGVDSSAFGFSGTGTEVFAEMMHNRELVEDSMEVVAGHWPENYDECVLMLSRTGRLMDYTLYSIGYYDPDLMEKLAKDTLDGKEVEAPETTQDFTVEKALELEFAVLPETALYQHNEAQNIWTSISNDEEKMKKLVDEAVRLKVVGVVQPTENAVASITQGILYTPELTEYLIAQATESEIVKQQKANKETDVFTGESFEDLREKQGADFDFGSMFEVDEEMLNSAFSFDTSGLNFSGMNLDMSGLNMDTSSMNIDPSAMQLDSSAIESVFSEDAMRQVMANAPAFSIENSGIADGATDLTPEQQESVNNAARDLSAGFSAWALANGKNIFDPNADTTAFFQEYMQTEVAQAIVAPLAEEFGGVVEQRINEAMQNYMQNVFAPYLSQAMTQMMTTAAQMMATQMATGMQQQIASVTSSLGSTLSTAISGQLQSQMANLQDTLSSGFSFDSDAFANAIKFNMTQDDLTSLLTNYLNADELSYDGNMKKLGYAEEDSPESLTIYPRDFVSKEAVLGIIDGYNEKVKAAGDEDSAIQYSDIAGVLMKSVTSIIDAISLVLIAFVSISLIVSSIMISIITYISVLERKKEIGILRAMGASKGNIANVFNAETFIEGLIAGVLAIAVVLAVSVPVNIFVEAGWDVPRIMSLPWSSALILIGISVLLTFLAGLIPSQAASRRDPVEALRSE